MNTETEYQPFGKEWEKEMSKWSKPLLIDLLKTKMIEAQRIKQSQEVKAPITDKKLLEQRSQLMSCMHMIYEYFGDLQNRVRLTRKEENTWKTIQRTMGDIQKNW